MNDAANFRTVVLTAFVASLTIAYCQAASASNKNSNTDESAPPNLSVNSPSSLRAGSPTNSPSTLQSTSQSTSRSLSRSTSPLLKRIDQCSLEKIVRATAKEKLVPGAVVLLLTPQGSFTVNYGTTELGAKNVPDMHTHFRIASNTKTMTAALILLLAQENKLKLSDSISKYVPNVPNGEKLTIKNLLEMRSGLYNCTEAQEFADSIDKTPERVWTPEEILAIAFNHPCTSEPGTTFLYDNTNYILLGLVVEKITGKQLAQVMQQRLFVPLRMRDTLLPVPTSNAITNPYSHGYLYGSSKVALADGSAYSPKFVADAKAGKVLPKDYTDVNHSFAAAAGGVTSNAADLAIWIKALNNGEIFNPEYQRIWHDSVQVEDPKVPAGTQYGYGIARMHWGPNSYYYHGGETPGYNSFMGFDPESKVTLVVWTNLTVDLDQQVTANTIMLKVLEQIYTASPIPPSPTSKPAAK